MPKEKPKVLLISAYPIQNSKPLQLLHDSPNFCTCVAYCILDSEKNWEGDEFINKSVFDTQVLEGYEWVNPKNKSPWPNLSKAYGLFNPGLIKLIYQSDACIIYGHFYASFWLSILCCLILRRPFCLSTDAIEIGRSNWKAALKKILFPFLYGQLARAVLVPSTRSLEYVKRLGVSNESIILTPYVVDNQAIKECASSVDLASTRDSWGIPLDHKIVIFCGKFLERKRPQDAIAALAALSLDNVHLVMIGQGPLDEELREQARSSDLEDRVHFLGLVPYSELPKAYAASDVLVHPAENEPYGLIVNEAMLCGTPVIVSAQVGAAKDLVHEGQTGFTHPVGDIAALSQRLEQLLSDERLLLKMSSNAEKRMLTWGPQENSVGHISAIEKLLA